MSVKNFQHYRLMGSRLYFKRDPSGGVNFPFSDLGTIGTASPTVDPQRVTLEDGDGGLAVEVDSGITRITEAYDITVSNLNLDNLAILFVANAPSALTVTAGTTVLSSQQLFPGRLFPVEDADSNQVTMLSAIAGVYSGTIATATVTAVSASGKTITVTEDLSALTGGGDFVILSGAGLANPLNAGTYTIVSTSGTGPTTLTVAESPVADESTITGALYWDNGSGVVYEPDVDFEAVSLDRGIGRVIDGGAISAEVSGVVVAVRKAITGNRIIKPHQLNGDVEGVARLYFSEENNAIQGLRQGRAQITPAGASWDLASFSNMTLRLTMLSDLSLVDPAGSFVQFKGDLPTKS